MENQIATPQKKLLGVLFFILALYNSVVVGKTIEVVKRLKHDLLSDYDKTFRPRINQSEPVNVKVIFELVSIQEFDEVQEKLTVTGVLGLEWYDDFMKWDPTAYNNTYNLIFYEDMVWSPDLVLVNNVDKIEKVGDSWQIVRFIYNGRAFYSPGDVFSASCQVDVTYYPFDRQTCTLQFNAWGYWGHEMNLIPVKVQTSFFSENGAWNFLGGETDVFFDIFILFYLNLERKPRFVVVNVILPIIFMSVLNILIFLIPTESGERISYCITVLLAMTVFLTLVGDNLPKTSNPMALFSFYLLSVLLLSICITLATIFSLHLYYQDEEKPVPERLKSFVQCTKCLCGRRKQRRKNRRENENSKESQDLNFATVTRDNSLPLESGVEIYASKLTSQKLNGSTGGNFNPALSRGNIYLDKPQGNKAFSTGLPINDRSDTGITWKDVSGACDKIFFILFSSVLVTVTLAFSVVILKGQP